MDANKKDVLIINKSQVNEAPVCVRHANEKSEAFACEHLITGNKLGFYFDNDDNQNAFPDAWCANCEQIRREHAGWNDISESLIKVKLVCGECYKEVKEKNALGSEIQGQ